MNQIKIAIRATIVLTILTGLAASLMAVWSRRTESPLAPN